MDVCDLTLIKTIHDLFWQDPFYVELYAVCLLSLVLFWKKMTKGRKFFLLYSVFCLVLFIYNPVFVYLVDKYLLHIDRVTARIFQLLPLLFTEAYVFASLVMTTAKRSKILSVGLTAAITALLLLFGITPWNRERLGFGVGMYLPAENLYKIPQEHIDICDEILEDMDGKRAVLAMYEMHGINDLGGTLNYSIRMYTSRIQLDEVLDIVSYTALSDEDRIIYWDKYITTIQGYETDNSNIYFLFPLEDERAYDLLEYGCYELPVESENYQVLVYSSTD